jgi:hypothetical protein
VKVNCNNSIDTHELKNLSHISGAHWNRLVVKSSVLSRVTVVWCHNSHAPGTSASAGGYHEDQLHQVVVDWALRWLHDVAVTARNVLSCELHVNLAICKLSHLALCKDSSQMLGDCLSQLWA